MCFSLPESDELHQLDPGDSVAESDWENESSCVHLRKLLKKILIVSQIKVFYLHVSLCDFIKTLNKVVSCQYTFMDIIVSVDFLKCHHSSSVYMNTYLH